MVPAPTSSTSAASLIFELQGRSTPRYFFRFGSSAPFGPSPADDAVPSLQASDHRAHASLQPALRSLLFAQTVPRLLR